jgi:Na+/proline symporter
MATQASAITFLSGPGQAFSDGMRFLQFYFGLPLAMIVLCITFIPIFRRLNVYTAYEYLEKRFDARTRLFTAFLFLLQRGISTGITIYAPSIVLSVILGINITYTTIFIGGIVIIYTVYGGTKAVSHTQLLQMCIIFAGLFCAAFVVVRMLPENIGFIDALHIAGKMERMNLIDTKFDWDNRYNIWSGIIGGFFLQLSYFGTDQSQVGRYLTGETDRQSRLGLLMNGLVKIPMQFLILLIGVLVYVFYQFHPQPVFFNASEVERIEKSAYKQEFQKLENSFKEIHYEKSKFLSDLKEGLDKNDQQRIDEARTNLQGATGREKEIKNSIAGLMQKNNSSADTNDTNYVFLTFVTQNLPVGLIGILIAIIFLASMGSTASGLNSLASTTTIDIYKRLINKKAGEAADLAVSRWTTVGWGVFCVMIGIYAGKMGNLLEAVNILGSLFYGTILGIFVVAFYMKRIGGKAVFFAAILAEVFIVIAWQINLTAFLWLNVIGCLLVMIFSWMFQALIKKGQSTDRPLQE